MIDHPTVRPTNYKIPERQIAERIGREYIEGDYTDEALVRDAAELVATINDVLYKRMLNEEGIEVNFVKDDPYPTYEAMVEDIETNNRLLVFSGGSHPEYFGIAAKAANLISRAVHDYWGHYKNDVDFSFWGEFQKWHYMKQYYPLLAHPFTFGEVVGQTGAAYYLDDGFNDPRFKQRPVYAPDHWVRLCYENCPVSLIE